MVMADTSERRVSLMAAAMAHQAQAVALRARAVLARMDGRAAEEHSYVADAEREQQLADALRAAAAQADRAGEA